RLYDIAQAMAAELPVGVAHLSKAERGYALAGKGIVEPVRAKRVPLAADLSAAKAFAAVGADCLRQIGANAEGLAAGGDEEFVHQLRVGVRRLRSLLKFMPELGPSTPLAPLDEDLQWLARVAGTACDWDVFAAEPPPPTTGAKRDRQLRKRSKRLRQLAPADRHRARIAAKKLRYAAEFFAPLYREARAARYIDALARLQGALGKLNDLATADRLLDDLA